MCDCSEGRLLLPARGERAKVWVSVGGWLCDMRIQSQNCPFEFPDWCFSFGGFRKAAAFSSWLMVCGCLQQGHTVDCMPMREERKGSRRVT